MTRTRALAILGIAAVLLAIAFYLRRGHAETRVTDLGPPAQATSVQSPVVVPQPALPAPDASAERSELADSLNSPKQDIHADLQVLATVLDAFRSNFPQRGNPTGTNAEITAALTGKNSLHLEFIPRDLPAINAKGELCDRWGHPFFFHQLSGTQMEIRSAGPDKKFWTDDDVVLSP